MAELEKVLRSALTNSEVPSTPLTSRPNKEIFWLFHELQNLILGQKSFDSFLDTLQHGQDAVWSIEDPLPFFALHYIQTPILFAHAILNGKVWNKVDFRLENDFLSFQNKY